jgi:rsbT co-antagonist protein RsbR
MLIGPQGTIVFGLLSLMGSLISIIFQSITEFEWVLSSIVLLGITTALISLLIYSLESAYNKAQEQLKIAEAARLDLLSREGELRLINTELTQTNSEMSQLLRLVQDLETPAIPLLNGVVVTPLVGHIDSRRAQNIYRSVIQATSEMKAHTLLIDMTGVPIIDQQVIQELQKLAQSVQLLGASVIMTGISPSIAQTMIALEADFSRIVTMGRLQDGIQYVIAQQTQK